MLKRVSILFLSALLLVTSVAPVLAAGSSDLDIRAAIQLAKRYFPETDEFVTFHSNIDSREGAVVYHLFWQDKGGEGHSRDSLTVRVDGNAGRIIGYSRDERQGEQKYPALPTFDKSASLQAAEAFLAHIVPGQFELVKLADVEEPRITVGSRRSWPHFYSFTFVHHVYDIAFPDNNMTVRVNADTGEVSDYHMNWREYDFPSPEGILSLEEAEEQFMGHGLKLMYLRPYSFRFPQPTPYLAYVLEEGYQLNIDAFTGEVRQSLTSQYTRSSRMDMVKEAQLGAGDNGFSEYELKEIALVEGLLTREEADALVRELMGIPAELSLHSAGLYRDYSDENLRVWSLRWYQERSDYYAHASANLNAKTGALLSFYYSDTLNLHKSDFTLLPEQAAKLAGDFLQKVAADEFKQVKLLNPKTEIKELEDLPYSYSFNYGRIYNDIPVQGDGLNVSVRQDGRIVSYSLNWYRDQLPSTEGVLSADGMGELFARNVGFNLEYVLEHKVSPVGEHRIVESEVRLVYRPAYRDRYTFNPRTGENVDGSGNVVEEKQKPVYADITGHWAAADIQQLVELGLLRLPGDAFNPDSGIILGDLLRMLADASGWNDRDVILPRAYAAYQDSAYANPLSYGMQYGLFTAEDGVDPEMVVTREMLAFYLARMLGHGHTASLKGIWTAPFADFSAVDEKYKGSVAIVYAEAVLGGDNQGRFLPKSVTTRAQVAVTLARMLRME